MKITINIDPETLFLVQKELQNIYGERRFYSMEERVKYSQKLELSEIFTRKCMSYMVSQNGKNRQISLKYHQAYVLYQSILERLNMVGLGVLEWTKFDLLKNQLHQKLM